jgi:hypothetical protein
MIRGTEEKNIAGKIWSYFRNFRDSSPYWRLQATTWGIILIILVAGGALSAVMALSGFYGGGNITYEAKGSPGPVTFRHYHHMYFQDGKYKACKTCHDKLFAAQTYGTYVLRALKDSPARKVRIGKETSTLYDPEIELTASATVVTYEVARACRTCATGNCHDGKESFSNLECLRCHQAH